MAKNVSIIAPKTRVTLGFMALGVIAWSLTLLYSNSDVLQLATLLGIGVVVPNLVNYWRQKSASD
jgi:hypothetical protein